MDVFIDCEFNGFGGELVSMALVTEDGDEFYEVLENNNIKLEPWVTENVIPFLHKDPIELKLFQVKLQSFLNRIDNITIIADWPEDISYFCKSLITGPGTMIKTESVIQFYIDRNISSKDSIIPHNALEDAKAIRSSYYEQF